MNRNNRRIGRLVLGCLFLLLPISGAEAQSDFRIMFYNVENLFDTKDDPEKNDDDFLPQGKQRWSNYRYWKKLNAVAQVIDSVGRVHLPALIGLCEVENDSVLFDLTKRSDLRKHKYGYIVSRSEDARGINVALLYQRDEIKILQVKEYTPPSDGLPYSPGRNILHVSGRIVNGDVLDIFVCHFKSRVGGIKKTRPYRIQAAKMLRQKTDSIMKIRKQANIVIMGDFNDYPDDESMRHTLGAQSIIHEKNSRELYNMFLHKANRKDAGSYRYRGRWIYPDQFIVSGNLLDPKRQTSVRQNEAAVYDAGFMLEDDIKYKGKKPFRTYLGFKYLGGYSDHLPIYIDLVIKE